MCKSDKKLTNGHMIYQFTGVLRPCQIAHLWSGVNTLQRPTSYRVPESNSSVCRPATTGQQAVLMGRPCYRLDSRQVFSVCLYGTDAACVPDKQLVIISSWCQMLMIWRPLQATHLTPHKTTYLLNTAINTILGVINSNRTWVLYKRLKLQPKNNAPSTINRCRPFFTAIIQASAHASVILGSLVVKTSSAETKTNTRTKTEKWNLKQIRIVQNNNLSLPPLQSRSEMQLAKFIKNCNLWY